VLAYSIIGRPRTIVWYVARIVSFCIPQQLVEVSALRILTVESAIRLVIVTCAPKLNALSNVRPSFFKFITVWYSDVVDGEIHCNF